MEILSEKQRRFIIFVFNLGCLIVGIFVIWFVEDIRIKLIGLYLMLHHLISDWGGAILWKK